MTNSTYALLQRVSLNATTNTVTLNVSGLTGYTDLKIVTSTRKVESGGGTNLQMRFNGTTAGYVQRTIIGNGSTAVSYYDTSEIGFMYVNDASQSANTFSSTEIYIPNYSTTQSVKSVDIMNVVENNAVGGAICLTAVTWTNAAPITTIYFQVGNGAANFAANSTFSVYGISKLDVNPPVPYAAGGDIVATDGTYWYHAFLNTGTFTPLIPLTCDVLQIAGGAGGGNGAGGGGGGGAGGVRADASQSLTATSYPVLVGAGGSGGIGAGSVYGLSGSNSIFASNTAALGGGGGAAGTASFGRGHSGGSGGGGGSYASTTYGGGTGTQGNNGGSGATSPAYGGGGGGGQGSAGSNGTTSVGGNGGLGANTITGWGSFSAMSAATKTGVSAYYAGGGGGGTNNGAAGGTGGSGTGGAGGPGNVGLPAVANTGGAGGGGGGSSSAGGSGGAGIIVVRYLA